MSSTRHSYLYAGAAVMLWASSPAVSTLLLRDITSIQLMAYSFLFCIIGLFVVAAVNGKLRLLRAYKKQDYIHMMVMGVLGCYLYYIFLFGALRVAPTQEAFSINYLWPMMVVVFAIVILKEKATIKKLCGLIISFFGVFVVATKGELLSFSFTNAVGDSMAALGAVAYGLFSVLVKKYRYETFTSMLLCYCIGFLLVLATLFVSSSLPVLTLQQLAGVAWIGVMSNALGFVCWFKALERGDTAKVANIIYLTPFVSLIYISFFVHEKILFSSIIGLSTIIFGIIIQSVRSRSQR